MFSNIIESLLTVFNLRSNAPEMRGKVEGMAIFHKYFSSNHILVTRNAEQYYNGIVERRRALIAYTQNIIIWLFAIKFQILALIRDEKVDLIFANPVALLKRPDIAAQGLSILTTLFGYIGKIIYYF